MPILDRRKDRFVEDRDTRVSVGIDFPFARVPNGDGYFQTTKTTVDAIKNNIKLLLKTNKSERVFQPNLGMGLKEILFEPLNDDTIIKIENEILDTFQIWLPFVELRDIQVNRVDSSNQVNVKIDFNLKRAPNYIESVEVDLTTGGTGAAESGGASGGGNVSGGTGGQSGPSTGGY